MTKSFEISVPPQTMLVGFVILCISATIQGKTVLGEGGGYVRAKDFPVISANFSGVIIGKNAIRIIVTKIILIIIIFAFELEGQLVKTDNLTNFKGLIHLRRFRYLTVKKKH